MVIWAKCNPIWAKCDPIWQIHMKSGQKCSRIAGRKFNHSVAKHEPRVARRGSRGQSSCRTLCNRTNNSYLLGLLRNVGLIFGIVNERNVGHGHCGLGPGRERIQPLSSVLAPGKGEWRREHGAAEQGGGNRDEAECGLAGCFGGEERAIVGPREKWRGEGVCVERAITGPE